MSINVNVSGNPVRINRGQLITADPDYAKKEFDKRRRMRIEQVRHQSKEIAENVRNKVRKEKKKQLSDFEKQEEEKLKKWQNRKLLELQQQYCESLKNIGLGHAQAVIENTHDEIQEEYKEKLKQKAKERGEIAEQKIQTEKNKDNLRKAIPLQHKKLSRDIENARSAMVSQNKKTPSKKRKKKRKTNINITTNLSDDSNSESDVEDIEELNILSDDYNSSLSEIQQSGARRKRTDSKSPPTVEEFTVRSPVRIREKSPKNTHKSQQMHKSQYKTGSPRSKSPLETVSEIHPLTSYPMDTRISDRIKSRRYLLSPSQTCDSSHVEVDARRRILQSEPSTSLNIGRRIDKTTSATYNQHVTEGVCSCKCTCSKHPIAEQDNKNEIPFKPTVALKTTKTTKDSEKDENKVQYYDHNNRFSKEYLSTNSNVKKIPEENIEIYPSIGDDKEYMERIQKYDKDAEERGRKAMEKLNIHKEYKEMMRQLPVLQNQERIASIHGDKPQFHMSDDRFKDYQKHKQNYMENVYERHFPKTITIAPKKHVIETEPFKIIDIPGSNPSLNVAQWDVNKQIDNGFSLIKDSGHILIESDPNSDNKEDYLKYFLERLKRQKEMLLQEVSSLPKNSNLTNIIKDLESFHDTGIESVLNLDQADAKLPSVDEYRYPYQGANTNIEEPKLTDKKSSKQKRMRQTIASTSSSSGSSTPSKKKKFKRYKIILQNTSTQTSPKTVVDSNANKENTRERVFNEETATTTTITTTKDKRPARKQSPRKSSSSMKTVKSAKVTVSRPTSPIQFTSARDQASSPIGTSTAIQGSGKTVSTRDHPIKCKCYYGKDQTNACRCKCHTHVTGDQSELCEILIKIKDNEEPEIQIKSPTKNRKNVIIKESADKRREEEKGKVIEDATKQKNKDTLKRTVKINENLDDKPKTSWREQFSKNEIAGTSTSTSYFSPPDFSKSDFSRRPQAESTGSRSTDKNKKPAQTKKKIDPRLLTYIKKLLSMSRTSIEDLGVSTVSDVSTPSESLFENVENSKNSSLNQLRNVIKYFNLNPEELAHYLNYSEDTEQTSGSLFDPNYTSPSTVNSSGYDAGKSHGNNASSSYSDQSKTQESRPASVNSKLSSNGGRVVSSSSPRDQIPYPTPISQYAKLAELCQKRISELTDMIEKVRMEKQQILSPIQSDKENSTQYLGLPSHLGAASPNMQDNASTNSDLEQAEINRKLLEIDYSLAERLKAMTPEQIKEYNRKMEESKSNSFDDTNRELLERFKKLTNLYGEKISENNGNKQRESTVKSIKMDGGKLNIQENIVPETGSDSIPYIPVLLDIPRLPKLVPNDGNNEVSSSDSQNGRQKKPPPAKGLIAAKRFNENITNVPHELSTIVEVDSQLSTKIRPSVSPIPSSDRISPFKPFENISPVIVLPEFPTDWPGKKHKTEENKTTEGSVPDILAEIAVNTEEIEKRDLVAQSTQQSRNMPLNINIVTVTKEQNLLQKNACTNTTCRTRLEQSTDSSTDKSETDNIESMLKSMGMSWAISTLRKTQEALNRVSSSSSLDAATKQLPQKSNSSLEIEIKSQQLTDNSSTSDVTLRDLLGQKLFSNSSASSISQIISPNFAKALEDLSAIQGSVRSSDNKQQRTSTPVHTTKSSESYKKGIFTAESEVSSVKLSDENFVTMRDSTGNSSD